jgi:hypothetical protein
VVRMGQKVVCLEEMGGDAFGDGFLGFRGLSGLDVGVGLPFSGFGKSLLSSSSPSSSLGGGSTSPSSSVSSTEAAGG